MLWAPQEATKGSPTRLSSDQGRPGPAPGHVRGSVPSGLTGSSLHKTEGEASFLTGHLWTPNPGPRLRRWRSNGQLSGAGVHRYTAWRHRAVRWGRADLPPSRPPTLLCPEAPVSVLPTVYFGGHCLHVKLVCSWRHFLACQVYTLHLSLLWSKNVNATPPAPPQVQPGPLQRSHPGQCQYFPLSRRVSTAPLPSVPNLLPT